MREPRTLTSDDLEQYPIWEEMGAEGGAYEGRLRPRPDLAIAADTESETNLFVVATTFMLADGSLLAGYCSPAPVAVISLRGWFRGIGLLQPAIVLERGQVPFWFREEPRREEILALYDILERDPTQVFPLEFEARVEVPPDSFASSRLDGFCFPRRPPFLSPFPSLNRTLLAERLGHVRFPDEHTRRSRLSRRPQKTP
jgi:hypothetical protein